ncbi:hypothetical protein AWJ14_11050 [Hoeflea olei]|uniref:Uncharacterized protein n=1 Tax=Hoeflea olei TaxID=1480615 RepID=A0A1C1Z1C4_9HYPH|nr:hypothetical protein AWJ14_11050 [Hoeflea olei]
MVPDLLRDVRIAGSTRRLVAFPDNQGMDPVRSDRGGCPPPERYSHGCLPDPTRFLIPTRFLMLK